MSVTIPNNLVGLTIEQTHCYAYCWRIQRTDGVVLRFTDHNEQIDVAGETYVPAGGFQASARQRQVGLQTKNLEVIGVLSSDAITNDDLRAGRYREAQVLEKLVDWRFPWAGVLMVNKYWIAETSWTGERWDAQIAGLTRWLRHNVGDVYSRMCRWDLGDSNCTKNLAAFTASGQVTVVTDQELFQTNLVFANDWYSFGKLTWTSGLNIGIVFEITGSDALNGKLRLDTSAPFTIVPGDQFTVIAGCNRKLSTCRDKFNNVINFGGFPDIPGTDAMIQTPNAH